MTIVAVYNIKGGVGKTAAAVNLAYLSARYGHRTLIWDLDPQGAASYYFRVKPKVKGGGWKLLNRPGKLERAIRGTDYTGLDLLPADFSYRNLDLFLDRTKRPARRLRKLLAPLQDDYDRIWIDCAPSISLVSESVFRAADALLVPTIPTTLSWNTLKQLAKHLKREGLDGLEVMPFFSMLDRRKKLHRELHEAADKSPFPFLETSIPESAVVERMGPERAPVPTFAHGSTADVAYTHLAREVERRLEELE